MCKHNDRIILEFSANSPIPKWKRANTCRFCESVKELKVFDINLVYKCKNQDGSTTVSSAQAIAFARNFEDINDLVKKQITPQIPEGAQLVSAEIKSI